MIGNFYSVHLCFDPSSSNVGIKGMRKVRINKECQNEKPTQSKSNSELKAESKAERKLA